MSALSLMCRTATLALLLVALTAGGAHAAQGSAPAKVHRKATATARAQATRHTAFAHGSHHASPARTRTQTQLSTARKPTPHEAGRAAGIAIRRKLAQKQAARRNVKLRVEHSRVPYSTARSASEHSLPITPQKEKRAASAMDVASASSVFLLRPAGSEEHAQGEEPAAADEPAAAEEMERPDASARNRPRTATPAPLLGSHESLERQNARLDAEGLERIEDESDLEDRIAHKLLVPIPASSALTVNAELSPTHRYCRPWTALFLTDLARAHDAAFHRPLEVSSAVRTMEYQKRLMEINGNAAPAEGDIVSPHLTGATIDIAKDGLSRDEIAWMRRRLLALQTAGKIDVEEEFRQACFHITVYKSYAPPRTSRPATQAGGGSTGTKRHRAPVPSGGTAAQGL